MEKLNGTRMEMLGGIEYISKNLWLYIPYMALFSAGILAGIIGKLSKAFLLKSVWRFTLKLWFNREPFDHRNHTLCQEASTKSDVFDDLEPLVVRSGGQRCC